MTQDDRTSDPFIREVDEELRREQLKSLWDRFGLLIIAVCVLVVVITGGYRGYVWWQAKQASETGDRYLTALESIEKGNVEEGRATLDKLASEGGGYGMLARLREAELAASGEDRSAALKAFDDIASDGSVPSVMRDLAHVRGALIALDAGDLDGAESRVEGLDEAGNPWRYSAREILGLVAYQRGDLEAARERFISIGEDAQAPQGLRSRAGLMIAVIDGQAETPAAGEAGTASDSGTAGAGEPNSAGEAASDTEMTQ
ncbi:tetratricopeptide repeat protein [Afifella sp. IM 167]|uniref:tetratricopeptide repeat protein n=1 Tax=Afifella sp. IM 167 TaxID=2033586 RepID=UPI001CCBF69C|nr:tetratricopeptide repeat protein [Afifella sp. IM 167]MBZ8131747.1 hypothetical protein [Afifella sp. IM 167]